MILTFLRAAALPQISTPYAQKSGLAIRSVRPAQTTVPCYGMLEVDIDASATFDNPFDPSDVSLDAKVIPSKGMAFSVPGYFDRPYSRRKQGNREVVEPVGPPRWKLRLAALKPGRHRVVVSLRDRTGTTSKEFTFTATTPKTAGFAHVSKRDKRFFETSDGKAFFPVGENLCWGGEQGTSDYDLWLPQLGAAKANYARLWLVPGFSMFSLEMPGKPSDGKGMGQFDLGNAWKLDYVMKLAARNGVRMLMTIESFNILRDKDGYPYWEQTPHNAANGGPLRTMQEFWTDPKMARFFRDKLRYLVARYGAMESVFAWEFWNEVDVIRDFQPKPIRAWHERMAKSLKEMDPYDHLVTTSLGETKGNPAVDLAPGIDFVQTHHYSSPDLAGMVAKTQLDKWGWGRPHIVGEIAADVSGDAHAEQDKKGYQAHDPIWASVATGCAGASQPWFWDSLIEPNKLYPLFTSVSKFVENVDFPGEGFKPVTPTLAFVREADRGRVDLTVIGEPSVWKADPLHQPKVLNVTGSKLSGPAISEMLHGTGNHPDWHNPVTFNVNLDRPTKLDIDTGRVSGYGGATLSVQVDGQEVLRRAFPDNDPDKGGEITDYTGTYTVTIPAGRHVVKVENVGQDWMSASYRFVAIAPAAAPPIDAWAVVGRRTVLGWTRVSGRTWPRVVIQKNAPETAPESMMRLAGIMPGVYRVVLWDTWAGVATRTSKVKVGQDRIATVAMPKIEGDLAFRLEKVK